MTRETTKQAVYTGGWYCADCSFETAADGADIETNDRLLSQTDDSPESGKCCICGDDFDANELKWFWAEVGPVDGEAA